MTRHGNGKRRMNFEGRARPVGGCGEGASKGLPQGAAYHVIKKGINTHDLSLFVGTKGAVVMLDLPCTHAAHLRCLPSLSCLVTVMPPSR